jgi:cytochrome oxidase Cu insertion factor (SCO1/SenC/PrrC family)
MLTVSSAYRDWRRKRSSALRRRFAFLFALVLALPSTGWAAGLPADLFRPSFELVDQTATPRSDRDFRGRFMLVYFGYTYCPDICPTGLQTMTAALDLLGEEGEKVQPLFITVDPRRDTPKALASYVTAFHPRLIGLTGSEDQIRAAVRSYRVHRVVVRLPDARGADDYLVNHSSLTVLMGPDGGFVTLFPHGTAPDAMAGALRRYLDGDKG